MSKRWRTMAKCTTPRTLRLGTRGSQLARWQADWVAGELRRLGHAVELVEIATHGDVDRARSIEEIGTRGVFTKAIQQALLAGDVDLAVHSLKDLPTEPVEGLVLAAVPPRESPADVLVVGQGRGSEGEGQRRRGPQVLAPRSCACIPAAAGGSRWHGELAAAGAVAALAARFACRGRARECRYAVAEAGRGAVRGDRAGRGGLRRLGLADRIRRCCHSM